MSTSSDDRAGYATPRGLELAIKSAARAAAGSRPGGADLNSLIQQVTFDRFLCRVFSEREPAFVLKGGTSMLARIPQARATLDIDLLTNESSLDSAVEELVALASADLEDHFRFVSTKRVALLEGENQPYARGARITFDAYLGLRPRGAVNIDLVVGSNPTAEPQRRPPANRLNALSLSTVDYVLYPVVDQISDKVCATMQPVGALARPSTRVKDLVDLVLLAQAEPVEAVQLWHALTSEMRRRQMAPIAAFSIPNDWERGYLKIRRRLTTDIPATAADAAELVASMLDPVLSRSVQEGNWDPISGGWRARASES